MKKHLTLLEILTVIAIIGILVSILLPSLQSAKKKSIQAVCLSNMDQSAKSFILFSKTNNWILPGAVAKNIHTQDLYHVHRRNLITDLADFMDWSSWNCAELPKRVNVNDLSNNRSGAIRGNFQYWTRIKHISGRNILSNFLAKNDPGNAFISDGSYIWDSESAWRTNHDSGGGIFWNGWSDNPSFMFYKGGTPRGINQIYVDGHGKWSRFNQMTVLATQAGATFYGAEDSVISN